MAPKHAVSSKHFNRGNNVALSNVGSKISPRHGTFQYPRLVVGGWPNTHTACSGHAKHSLPWLGFQKPSLQMHADTFCALVVKVVERGGQGSQINLPSLSRPAKLPSPHTQDASLVATAVPTVVDWGGQNVQDGVPDSCAYLPVMHWVHSCWFFSGCLKPRGHSEHLWD